MTALVQLQHISSQSDRHVPEAEVDAVDAPVLVVPPDTGEESVDAPEEAPPVESIDTTGPKEKPSQEGASRTEGGPVTHVL